MSQTIMSTEPTSARSGKPEVRTSQHRAARIAGFGYVAIFLLAIFANFFVVEGLVVPGDATATAANLTESIGMFRWGFVAFLAVFGLDVVIAWALHVVFRGVHNDVSLLAAWSRLVYTVFLGVALVFYFQAMQLVSGAQALNSFTPDQINTQVLMAMEAFNATWLIGLAVFGLHLVLIGWLLIRSSYTSKVLGYLLMTAGAAYAADTIAHAVLTDYEAVSGFFLAIVAIPSVIGEGWLGLWLLRTRKLPR